MEIDFFRPPTCIDILNWRHFAITSNQLEKVFLIKELSHNVKRYNYIPQLTRIMIIDINNKKLFITQDRNLIFGTTRGCQINQNKLVSPNLTQKEKNEVLKQIATLAIKKLNITLDDVSIISPNIKFKDIKK
jgi:hypothetical protein